MHFSVLVNSKQKDFFMIVVREKRNENRVTVILRAFLLH